ncbi:hypothetical protein I3760_09G015700 [Carya illinoinensis]|nr:hypothetical protein I3760_09G015700 [Carya illinoinensis]
MKAWSILYPDETFITLDQCFNDFLVKVDRKSISTDEITTTSPMAESMAITATCG